MPTIETTVSVTVPEGVTVGELEAAIQEELREAGRRLLTEGVAELEKVEFDGADGRWLRDRRRQRQLLTVFGWIDLERWYVRERSSGRYRFLVEMGGGHEHATVGVVDQAVALATRIPYRQATCLLSRFLRADIDHRTLYSWVQAEGAAIVEEEETLQSEVFEQGVVPPRDERERELVVSVLDGTYLKAQREGQASFEVRIGVAYSGRESVGKRAKWRRYRLKERHLYSGVESAADFAERFYISAEAGIGLGSARHLLVIGDGAEWIETIAGHDRYRATYQLDHWHILDHARRTFPDRPKFIERLATALRRGQTGRLLALVSAARLTAGANKERVDQFFAYLAANSHGIHGARRLRRSLSEAGQLAAVEGSGAVEKQGDLLVSRRFKHAGMRWTKAGANRLLKLRVRELERAA